MKLTNTFICKNAIDKCYFVTFEVPNNTLVNNYMLVPDAWSSEIILPSKEIVRVGFNPVTNSNMYNYFLSIWSLVEQKKLNTYLQIGKNPGECELIRMLKQVHEINLSLREFLGIRFLLETGIWTNSLNISIFAEGFVYTANS